MRQNYNLFLGFILKTKWLKEINAKTAYATMLPYLCKSACIWNNEWKEYICNDLVTQENGF